MKLICGGKQRWEMAWVCLLPFFPEAQLQAAALSTAGWGDGGWLSLDSELRPKCLFSYALRLSEYLPLQPQRAMFTSPLTDWSFHSFVGLCAHSGMFISTHWVTPFMSSHMSFSPYPSFSYFPLYCVVLSMSDRQGKMVFNSYFSLDRLESRLGEGGSGVWVYDRP